MLNDEPREESTPQPPDASTEPDQSTVPEQPQAPAPKRADVLRDFRKTLADRHRPGGGKHNKPTGGNPRFR